jgi:hypothetical protein
VKNQNQNQTQNQNQKMSVAKEANLASKEGWDKVINIIPF